MTPGSDRGAGPAGASPPRWVRSRAVFERRGEFGIALLARDGHDVRVLAGTGAAVWDAFRSPATVDEVAAALADAFAADPVTVRRDVDPLVDELRARGLLVTA
jgi:hypothetical protein